MAETPRSTEPDDDDTPLAGEARTEQEKEELASGGNAAEVVESEDGDGPAKTPGG